MPTNEEAFRGKKNKKTTADPIPGKEKAKDRRESSLPSNQSNTGKSDNNDKGKAKPKKKD